MEYFVNVPSLQFSMIPFWVDMYLMVMLPLGAFLVILNANRYQIDDKIRFVGICTGGFIYAAAFFSIVMAIPASWWPQ